MNPIKDFPNLAETTVYYFADRLNKHYKKNYPLQHGLYAMTLDKDSFNAFPVADFLQVYEVLTLYHGYWSHRLYQLINTCMDGQEPDNTFTFCLTATVTTGQGKSNPLHVWFRGMGAGEGAHFIGGLVVGLSAMHSFHKYQFALLDTALEDFVSEIASALSKKALQPVLDILRGTHEPKRELNRSDLKEVLTRLKDGKTRL